MGATMATKRNDVKSTVAAHAEQLIAGAEASLAGLPSIMLGGHAYTPAELTARLKRVVTLRAAVDKAKAATAAALADEEAELPALRALMGDLVTYAKAAHARQPDALATFGIHPKARTPATVAARVTAVAKRASTRAARHTMGPVARKAVKGDVTGVKVTPVTASATAPTTDVPAPASPPSPSATPVTPAATPATRG
jgi:hypothetical protein